MIVYRSAEAPPDPLLGFAADRDQRAREVEA
jgi:hypothetical protein